MPTYVYRCKKCGKEFEAVQTMEQHLSKKPSCSKCSSTSVERIYTSFLAKTSKKS